MRRIEPGHRHRFIAWLHLSTSFIYITRLWVKAYTTPTKAVTLHINLFGEATMEMTGILLMAPSTVYVLVAMIHNLVLDVIDMEDETEVI